MGAVGGSQQRWRRKRRRGRGGVEEKVENVEIERRSEGEK